MKAMLLWLAAVGGLAVSGSLVEGLSAHTVASSHMEALNAHEEHASASLFGQFRASVTSWLWLRTDLYLHNGVEMRKRREGEAAGEVNADNARGELHDDTAITTVVPSPHEDFRGWFGDMERATAAYRDMRRHEHNDPRKVLPLFRLMTWMDPGFIPGWTVGAAVLCRDGMPGARQAAEFLREGLRHNPTSVALLSDLGALHAVELKDRATAIRLFERAIRAAPGTDHVLSEDDLEGLRSAFRYLTLIYRDAERWEDRRRIVRWGLERFPDDGVLRRNSDATERRHEVGQANRAEVQREKGADWKREVEGGRGHVHGPGCGHEHGAQGDDEGHVHGPGCGHDH